MAKTKQEILGLSFYPHECGSMIDCVTKNDALKAMSEYAQQTAIEFDEWKREEGYKLSFRNQEKWYIPNEGTEVFKYFSNEELYSLYLKSKTK